MEKRRETLDALMGRFSDMGPQFKVCAPNLIEYWRWMGWFLLADARDLRDQDIDDTRRADERWRRDD